MGNEDMKEMANIAWIAKPTNIKEFVEILNDKRHCRDFGIWGCFFNFG